jgi:hypothetical protein
MWQMLSPDQEAREDLFYGQLVVIVARWFLIGAGVVLALWSASSVEAIMLPIGLMIVLMGMNFYLHGRYLVKQPVQAPLVYLSSAIDLLVITLIVVFWTQGRGTGLASPFFVFYYPALLAFALVFRPRISLVYAAVVIGVYLLVVLVGSGTGDLRAQKTLLERLITMAATAGLGAYFWRLQRRRREDGETEDELLPRVEERVSASGRIEERLPASGGL